MKWIEFNPEERLYCSVAAAIIGSSVVGAGSQIWGASKAADAQGAAAKASIAQQQQMYESNKNLLSPFIDAGRGASERLVDWTNPNNGNNLLSHLMKLVTPGADMSATLEQTPGYQFAQKQGTRGALNALAARGLGGSPGAIAKGVSNYNSGLASQTWDSVVKNLLSTFGSGTNALQGLVNSGVTSGSSLAGVGTNTANSISGAMTGAGNAQAASYNAMGQAIGNVGQSLGTASLLQQLTSGNGGGSIYNDPSFGGNGIWGGSSQNPLPGLDASDYGPGF